MRRETTSFMSDDLISNWTLLNITVTSNCLPSSFFITFAKHQSLSHRQSQSLRTELREKEEEQKKTTIKKSTRNDNENSKQNTIHIRFFKYLSCSIVISTIHRFFRRRFEMIHVSELSHHLHARMCVLPLTQRNYLSKIAVERSDEKTKYHLKWPVH